MAWKIPAAQEESSLLQQASWNAAKLIPSGVIRRDTLPCMLNGQASSPLFGACLGALAAALVLVPVAGIGGTCLIAASLVGSAALLIAVDPLWSRVGQAG